MRSSRSRQIGVTFLLSLFAIAALGIATASGGTMWSTARQREREAELLFIGGEFARALTTYRLSTSDGTASRPGQLEELLLDPRVPFVRRHLRKLYRDPLTGEADWQLERVGGRIVGVRSRSEKSVMRTASLPPFVTVRGSRGAGIRYCDLVFHPDEVSR